MAEYIKRADAMKVCQEYSSHCFVSNDANGQDIADRIEDDIVKIPTADVVEVKHGHWITDENGIVICSECGEEHAWDEYRATYCEDCGTKMDGGS